MDNSFLLLFKNKVFISAFLGWLVAQAFKIIINGIREKRFDFKWFIGTGGMPSSHAAFVMSLATAVGLQEGFSSTIFIVILIVALVIAFDAQGVRRATGKQAEILNMILDDIYWRRKIQENRLIELIGHTPFEVIVGSLIGVIVAIFVMG
ncbi:MAG: hypothetical protein AMJ78_03205 [Omnitrophica WOR_2 bacterium SM23_29]|nr:MAG: hypothetical protein AMJ78_03205 [Omnitrophica WOR_2 bacterium SM23_29]